MNASTIDGATRKPMTVTVEVDKYIALLKDAARYCWLKEQAVSGDWGHHFGWRLHVDIKGAPSLETLDQAIDALVIDGRQDG